MIEELRLLARYNAWMNEKLYAAAATLPAGELARDRGAFFKSILGTLNHLMVADTVWLKRFAAHPADFAALRPVRSHPTPTRLDETLFEDFAALRAHREALDKVICAWLDELTEPRLEDPLRYANMKGVVSTKRLGSLMLHFFNHQTHHRGQATTLLSQAGVDVGVTDLLVLVP